MASLLASLLSFFSWLLSVNLSAPVTHSFSLLFSVSIFLSKLFFPLVCDDELLIFFMLLLVFSCVLIFHHCGNMAFTPHQYLSRQVRPAIILLSNKYIT